MPNLKLVNKYTNQIESYRAQIIGIKKKLKTASIESSRNLHRENWKTALFSLRQALKNLKKAQNEDCDNTSYEKEKEEAKVLNSKLQKLIPVKKVLAPKSGEIKNGTNKPFKKRKNKNENNPHKGLNLKKNQIIEAFVERVDLKKVVLLYQDKYSLTLPNSELNKKQVTLFENLKVKVLSIKKNDIIVSLKF